MTAVVALLRRHSVLLYFVLTVALSWVGMLIAVGSGGLPMTAEQFETRGPFVYLAMLAGPSVAALLSIALVDGRSGFRALLSRLLRWRVGARWYAVAFLVAPLSIATALLALSLFFGEFPPAVITTSDRLSVLVSSMAAGLVVGFFEELGWTGFAVPQLRQRYSPLATGIMVGILWGGWHFLVFWESESFSGVLPLALLFVRLFSWLPAYRVLMVWVYDRTESLLIAVLMHASLVASQFVLFPQTLEGATALISILAWAVVLWVIVAAVAMVNGRR